MVLLCFLVSALSAFAYYDDYGYSRHSDDMSGFEVFILIVMIAYIIFSLIIINRWWKMTKNVEKIRKQITHENLEFAYLVAIGEKEQAQKAALTMMVDKLYSIYNDYVIYKKAAKMNEIIEENQPDFTRLGLTLPDYVTTGEKFIDYLNGLTGEKVEYDTSLDT